MYIVERIISIALFLIVTFVAYLNIYKSQNNYNKIKKIFIVYILCLCVFSFLYVPAETADLTRLRIYINHRYSGMGFYEFVDGLKNTSTFTTHCLYYFVTKLGVIQLLSVISCLINYSIICYILYDYTKAKKMSSFTIANAFLLYMLNGQFLEVISDIRSMCAFSIFFFCIYKECFKNKSVVKNTPFYLIAIGFHNAIVPAIIIRFLFLFFQKEKSIYRKIINFIYLLIMAFFAYKFGNNVVESTMTKANNYINNDIYSYYWTYLSTVLTIVIMIYVYIINLKIIKVNISKNYYRLFFIYLIITILFGTVMFEYTIFRRYTKLVLMLFLPIVILCFNYKNKISKYQIRKRDVLYYLLLYSIMFIEISRGDLCGIRYFTFR